MTGESGLTLEEAMESEKLAMQQIHKHCFPNVHLCRALLYLITKLPPTSSLHELCDRLYDLTRDRFFVGENVDFVTTDTYISNPRFTFPQLFFSYFNFYFSLF